MADSETSFFIIFTQVSNVVTTTLAVIMFCSMLLFVMRCFMLSFRNMTVFWLHGEDLVFSSVHTVPQQIPQITMMKVHIPFTFKLHETSLNSGTGVTCKISSQVPYRLQAYWGVSIRELHLFLWRPWSSINAAVQQGSLLSGHYQVKGPSFIEECSHAEKTVCMRLPDTCMDLGTPPRLYYPLVVLLIRDNPGNVHPDETVALINVVHIKDNVCTLPTSILAQYLKQANGQLSTLKQLYLASGNSLTYDDGDVGKERNSGLSDAVCEQLCVVCQYFPLSRALLPCRHTCICASCFAKLECCPMCRSPIKSYFCVRSEEYLSSVDCDSEKTPPPVKQNRVARWIVNRLFEAIGMAEH